MLVLLILKHTKITTRISPRVESVVHTAHTDSTTVVTCTLPLVSGVVAMVADSDCILVVAVVADSDCILVVAVVADSDCILVVAMVADSDCTLVVAMVADSDCILVVTAIADVVGCIGKVDEMLM